MKTNRQPQYTLPEVVSGTGVPVSSALPPPREPKLFLKLRDATPEQQAAAASFDDFEGSDTFSERRTILTTQPEVGEIHQQVAAVINEIVPLALATIVNVQTAHDVKSRDSLPNTLITQFDNMAEGLRKISGLWATMRENLLDRYPAQREFINHTDQWVEERLLDLNGRLQLGQQYLDHLLRPNSAPSRGPSPQARPDQRVPT